MVIYIFIILLCLLILNKFIFEKFTVKECIPNGTNPASCWRNIDSSVNCHNGTKFLVDKNSDLKECDKLKGMCKCPNHTPYMCAFKTNLTSTGDVGYWCKKTEKECSKLGGLRLCEYQSANEIEIFSNSFKNNGVITQRHACLDKGGSNLSPHIHFRHPHNNLIKGYTLILEDLDSVDDNDNNYIHLMLPFISAKYETILESNSLEIIPEVILPESVQIQKYNYVNETDNREIFQSKNSAGTIGYTGLCPSSNNYHNYLLSIFALSGNPVNSKSSLNNSSKTFKINECRECTKEKLMSEIKDYIVYTGSVTFTFKGADNNKIKN